MEYSNGLVSYNSLLVFEDAELEALSNVLFKNNILHRLSVEKNDTVKDKSGNNVRSYVLYLKEKLSEERNALIWSQYTTELENAKTNPEKGISVHFAVEKDEEILVLSSLLFKKNILHRILIDELEEGKNAYVVHLASVIDMETNNNIWAQYLIEFDEAYPKE